MPSIENQQIDVPTVTEEEIEGWFEDEEEERPEASVVSTQENLERKYSESQLRIVRTAHDFTLHTLRESLKDSNYINLAPSYQRRTRWDRKRRSQLIESFLMNIPVPPIFLFENRYNQYEVMDGRQRLETIRDFLDNRFSLIGLEFWKELRGQRFSDLHPTLQRGLLRRSITAIVLLAETSKPEDSEIDVRMVLFRRLNTGGARLNPQEMRNALYTGLFNQMLVELARGDLFTTIWRIPHATLDEQESPPPELRTNALYRTMADCELVLRFFAIKETIELNLKGSLGKLLDSCMVRHAEEERDTIKRHKGLFTKCLKALFETFDEKPFILPKTGRPSRPLYDALMVAMSLNPGFNPIPVKEEIQQRLAEALKDNETYDILVGRGNTIDAIKARVKTAETILRG